MEDRSNSLFANLVTSQLPEENAPHEKVHVEEDEDHDIYKMTYQLILHRMAKKALTIKTQSLPKIISQSSSTSRQ